ncbi:unnamed protein product, partial [Lampetra planeri]
MCAAVGDAASSSSSSSPLIVVVVVIVAGRWRKQQQQHHHRHPPSPPHRPPSTSESVSVWSARHPGRLLSSLAALRRRGAFCDAVVEVETSRFLVHKAVLCHHPPPPPPPSPRPPATPQPVSRHPPASSSSSAVSPAGAAVDPVVGTGCGGTGTGMGPFVLPAVSAPSFERALDFVYSGRAVVRPAEVEELRQFRRRSEAGGGRSGVAARNGGETPGAAGTPTVPCRSGAGVRHWRIETAAGGGRGAVGAGGEAGEGGRAPGHRAGRRG